MSHRKHPNKIKHKTANCSTENGRNEANLNQIIIRQKSDLACVKSSLDQQQMLEESFELKTPPN